MFALLFLSPIGFPPSSVEVLSRFLVSRQREQAEFLKNKPIYQSISLSHLFENSGQAHQWFMCHAF